MAKQKVSKVLVQELQFSKVVQSGKFPSSKFFGTSKRLKILAKIGYSCVCCGRTATKLHKFEDLKGKGRQFWSILSEDNVEITIDHIKPKSLGGRDRIENYQTMCQNCNFEKGNTLDLVPFTDFKGNIVGKELWIKSDIFRFKGIIDRVDTNPYTGNNEIFTESERNSSYKINKNAFINRTLS